LDREYPNSSYEKATNASFSTLKISRNQANFWHLSFFLFIFKFILRTRTLYLLRTNNVGMKTAFQKYCLLFVILFIGSIAHSQTTSNVKLNFTLNPIGSIVINTNTFNTQDYLVAYNENNKVSLEIFSSQNFDIKVSAKDNFNNETVLTSRNNINAGNIDVKNSLAFDNKYFAKYQNQASNLFYYAVAGNEITPDKKATVIYTVTNP
jgi:uncharacterized membrane protein YhaH (DUF805 family)